MSSLDKRATVLLGTFTQPEGTAHTEGIDIMSTTTTAARTLAVAYASFKDHAATTETYARSVIDAAIGAVEAGSTAAEVATARGNQDKATANALLKIGRAYLNMGAAGRGKDGKAVAPKCGASRLVTDVTGVRFNGAGPAINALVAKASSPDGFADAVAGLKPKTDKTPPTRASRIRSVANVAQALAESDEETPLTDEERALLTAAMRNLRAMIAADEARAAVAA